MLDSLRVTQSGDKVSVSVSSDQVTKAIYTNAARPWVNISDSETERLRNFIEQQARNKL